MNPFIIMPAIGALIGAVTNELAIRMLFRPYKAIYFLGLKLPFTPGVIPSQREVIAGNIAETFEKHLLSGQEIHDMLTSKDMHEALESQVAEGLKQELPKILSEPQLINKASQIIHGAVLSTAEEKIVAFSQKRGRELADNIIDDALQSLGSMVAMMASPFKGKIVDKVLQGIDQFIQETLIELKDDSTRELISQSLEKELKALKTEEIAQSLAPKVSQMIIDGLSKAIQQALSDGHLDIRKKIEKRINELDIKQLEEIILGFSKEQFRYITLFGAILGAIIGLIQASLLGLY